jgi:hypothetical protein
LSGFSTIVFVGVCVVRVWYYCICGSLCCQCLVLLYLWEFVLSGFSTIVFVGVCVVMVLVLLYLWEFVVSGFSAIVFVGVCVVRV